MDAFELLKTDHEKVSQLFKEIESATGQAKRQLFTRLKGELDLHAHIEETVFYPALENTDEAREITLEAYEEHKVVKDLLTALVGGPTDDEWEAKLTVLKENVEHHVEEEEGELFSKARLALNSEQIDRIGSEIQAEKARAQGGTTTKQPNRQSSKRQLTKSTKNQGGAAARQPSKAGKTSESPGVLKRLAGLIGLGEETATARKGTKKKAGKAPSARKASSRTRSTTTAKKATKRGTSRASAKSTKKSATKTRSAGKRRTGGKVKVAAKATKRKGSSAPARTSTRTATRSGGSKSGRSKKGKAPTAAKRKRTR